MHVKRILEREKIMCRITREKFYEHRRECPYCGAGFSEKTKTPNPPARIDQALAGHLRYAHYETRFELWWKGEVVDTARSRNEAEWMVGEYMMAFGDPRCKFQIKDTLGKKRSA